MTHHNNYNHSTNYTCITSLYDKSVHYVIPHFTIQTMTWVLHAIFNVVCGGKKNILKFSTRVKTIVDQKKILKKAGVV